MARKLPTLYTVFECLLFQRRDIDGRRLRRFSATFAVNEDGGLELELDRLSDWSSIISG